MTFERGLYETLLTGALQGRLDTLSEALFRVAPLHAADAADRFALHVARVVERAIESFPEKERALAGAQIAGTLIQSLAATSRGGAFREESPIVPPQVLRGIMGRRPDGTAEVIGEPMIPLLDTALLTNSPGEPRVGHQIQTEIASADQVDVIMAFIRRSGLQPFIEPLRRHVHQGRRLRVLTTTYTGSTEGEALALLAELGAEVRVSYDTSSTRLHAKAWLFHRASGFSTAYVGSSNITHSAQVNGLEWNVRLSEARNRAVLEKIAAVFDSYWQQPDFVPFARAVFDTLTSRERRSDNAIALSPIEVRLEPFQERLLEQLALARRQGRHRNLLVSATGTGKTVMAAVDYARLVGTLPRARLLFVAHREEILRQSQATFAHVLQDGNFGELWVGGRRPADFEHVFASIQSLVASGLSSLHPEHFDVVIVDEFHHAAADSYRTLLAAVSPRELLGLTATPERSDGVPILDWFDGRIAAELRLWDAIDQHRLTPFAYYGIADDLDLTEIPWRRGRGYDVEQLTHLITSTDVWARGVVRAFEKYVGSVTASRALGFCVSIEHARYMARVFTACDIKATAVWADSSPEARKSALTDLAAGRVNVVFSVDLFNEGIDVPIVDTLLMLRPTDSGLLFLQQLGRGLRRAAGKSLCTVLDFVGQHRKEFRYDRRFRALLGGTRRSLETQIIAGFPFLPAGCHMQLDRKSTERVLDSIRNSLPSRWTDKAAELRAHYETDPELTLRAFLLESGLDLDDVYDGQRGWSDLKDAAGIPLFAAGFHEASIRKACGRLLHVDDSVRLNAWREWLRHEEPPVVDALGDAELRLLRMLLAQLLDQVASPGMTLADGAALLWSHRQVRAELQDLLEVLASRIEHLPVSIDQLPNIPVVMPARYTRLEMLAAFDAADGCKMPAWREGAKYFADKHTDVFAFTLDKTSGQFSPTTRYRDYAISPDLIHWESQSTTGAESPTGRRYREHAAIGNHVLLFCRRRADERAFYCLGLGNYVSHSGERPMAITWRLARALPGDLFQQFAAAVA